MPLELFHPLIRQWFSARFGEPTEPQRRGWPEIAAGRHTLIAAPTGSGKTLAAFLVCIDRLFRDWLDGRLASGVEVVYVSPLKALSNDIQRNLQSPLAEIAALAAAAGLGELPIRTAVRTGDTPAAERQALVRNPPHILVTTPESLYLLLTAAKSRQKLGTVKTVIVDEIHALARDKRGSHLALSLERLARLCPAPPTRIGLSATQKPIDQIGALLVGAGNEGQRVQGSGVRGQQNRDPWSGPGDRGQETGGRSQELGGRGQETGDTYPSSLVSHPSSDPSPPTPAQARESRLPVIVDTGHARDLDLGLELPKSELAAVCTYEHWEELYERLKELITAHRSTLVFVNTRRLAERVAFRLGEHLGEEAVASHHGSLSREIRLDAEQRLKSGQLKAIVATASLEMGIDIGYIDLVCQIGSPRSIATFLQRVGRSGHAVGALPKGRLFPLTRDELLECLALVRAVRRGVLDQIEIPEAPLDILAQQIVAEVAAEEWDEDALFACFRRAYPYRELPREKFDAIVRMLADGIKPGSKAGAYLHRDQIHRRLRARRPARLAALTSGGAIPETAQYRVVTEPEGTFVGTVDEDFAVESLRGDVFLLGNTSWIIRAVTNAEVIVADAQGAPPTIPFWLGEAPGRTIELSQELSELRRELARRVQGSGFGREETGDRRQETGVRSQGAEAKSQENHSSLISHLSSPLPSQPPATRHQALAHSDPLVWLEAECGCDAAVAAQAVKYVAAQQAATGLVPTGDEIVFERFFDESGGMQLVIHAPLGARINKAWGLALRKRFCRSFDFELQAAADDNGIVLSLGPQHSFPIDSLFGMLSAQNGQYLLEQAVLAVPMFQVRWRWNVTRALAVLRQQGGKKVPPFLQKFRSEDLLAAAFPETVGCLENHHGDVQVPDHPLVAQTMHDCLTEAMDVRRWLQVLEAIKEKRVRLVPIETREPSPFSHQLLNANPYAFLDDAPLEERRTRAVTVRRSLAIDEVKDLARLDPAAIAQVAAEAWPLVRDADELHDALMNFVVLPPEEGREWERWFTELCRAGRAALVAIRGEAKGAGGANGSGLADGPQPGSAKFWIAAERWPLVRTVYPGAAVQPALALPEHLAQQACETADGRVEIVRGHLQCRGPHTAEELAALLHLAPSQVFAALEALEGSGVAMRGRFREEGSGFGVQGSGDGSSKFKVQGSKLENQGSTVGSGNLEHAAGNGEQPPATQWCERRLLARIHRLTLDGLRRRIEPVAPEVYWQYLLEHQHLAEGRQLQGELGLREVIGQLAGYELPAGVWEAKVLAARLADYDPQWLDHLFLSGELVWGRLRPPHRDEKDGPGMAALSRSMPISVVPRGELEWLLPADRPDVSAFAGGAAQEVLAALAARGALFFQDLRALTGLLPAQLEEALRELAALGLVTSDTFAAVRSIAGAQSKTVARLRRFSKTFVHRPTSPVGRWSPFPVAHPSAPLPLAQDDARGISATRAEQWCRLLLARYGVLFRDLLSREPAAPPWWELVRVLRRMELRGEVRGGRFIARVGGEQFALETAVTRLRDLRDSAGNDARQGEPPPWVLISAADPLNLTGVLTEGPRIPAVHTNALVLQNGRCIAAKVGGRIEFLAEIEPGPQLLIRKSLQVGRKVRPAAVAAVPEPHVFPKAARSGSRQRPPDPTELHSRRRFGV